MFKQMHIMFLFSFFFSLVSCGDIENENGKSLFEIDQTSYHISCKGGSISISMRSAADWQVECGQEWIEVLTVSGKGYG